MSKETSEAGATRSRYLVAASGLSVVAVAVTCIVTANEVRSSENHGFNSPYSEKPYVCPAADARCVTFEGKPFGLDPIRYGKFVISKSGYGRIVFQNMGKPDTNGVVNLHCDSSNTLTGNLAFGPELMTSFIPSVVTTGIQSKKEPLCVDGKLAPAPAIEYISQVTLPGLSTS